MKYDFQIFPFLYFSFLKDNTQCWGDYDLCFAIQDVKSYLSVRKLFLLTKLPFISPGHMKGERNKKKTLNCGKEVGA